MVPLTLGTVDFNLMVRDFVFSRKFDKTGKMYKHLLENNKKNVTASNFRALFLNFKHVL